MGWRTTRTGMPSGNPANSSGVIEGTRCAGRFQVTSTSKFAVFESWAPMALRILFSGGRMSESTPLGEQGGDGAEGAKAPVADKEIAFFQSAL